MSYGNGYAVYGRPPVFSGCAVSSDLAAHLDDIDRAEKRAEHVDSCVEDAVEVLMRGPDDRDLICHVDGQGAHYLNRRVRDMLNVEERTCTAQTSAEWQRVLYAAPADALVWLVLSWREWFLKRASDYSEVQRLAEEIADDQDAINAEDAAFARAGL